MAASTGRRRATSRRDSPDDGLDLGSDKLYFKIGEVADILGVAPHVLRYWESEFSEVRPRKSRTQQRVYRRRDVATLLRIKHLLYEQKFTIAGARQQLKDRSGDRDPSQLAAPSGLYRARQSLGKVRKLLDEARGFCDSRSELERQAADPARYVHQVGGVRAVLDGGTRPEDSIVARPPRQPRSS